MMNKEREGHPRNVCEFKGCSNTNTEVEKVAGHRLSLCETHGPENSYILTGISSEKMEQWAMTNLKARSAKKFQKVETEVSSSYL